MTAGQVVRAVAVVDELVTDSGAVVLVRSGENDRVVRLSPLGAAVRTLAGDGMPLSWVAGQLTSAFGEPASGDAVEATAAVVAELEALGLVIVEG